MGTRMTQRLAVALSVAAALAIPLAGVVALAQEHPHEHPGSKKGADEKAGVTRDALVKAIKDYVKRDADLKGGYFLVYDTVAKRPLALTLEKVHDDKLARVSDKVYFACADFKSTDGAIYDLDIFLKGSTADDLQVTEVTVHKENGKERYGWVEEGGFWKRK